MPCPNTRDFSAWVNLMPGSPTQLIVQGEVETNAGNIVPIFKEASPTGINEKVLILDLHLVNLQQPGTQDVNYRSARFEKAANPRQYDQVEIRSEGEICFSLPVKEAY